MPTATAEIEERDAEAAAEVIEHLTQQEPPENAKPLPIEPIDQTLRPAPPSPKPMKIVDLEDAAKPAKKGGPKGTSFFCGEVGLITFEDKTTYHVKHRHFEVSDPDLVAKLKKLAEENPSQKLFVTSE